VDEKRFDSSDQDGLFAILYAAARVAAGSEHEPVGVLEIFPDEPEKPNGQAPVAIEAAFAYQGARRVVERLDVRARTTLETAATVELASSALLRFGAQRYTNFVVARAAADRASGPYRVRDNGAASRDELIDLTVYFPTRVPWWSRNLLLASEVSGAEQEACTALCDALGVRWHARNHVLSAPGSQVRGLMTEERQLAAFRRMLEGGWHVTVYAAALPATRSVRVESSCADEHGARHVDVTLSRGLQGSAAILSSDAEAMERLLRQHAGVRLSSRSWRVTNAHADPEAQREQATSKPKSGLKWQTLRRRRR
jgi:hypothetical protein